VFGEKQSPLGPESPVLLFFQLTPTLRGILGQSTGELALRRRTADEGNLPAISCKRLKK
jgi:hypothetical protein